VIFLTKVFSAILNIENIIYYKNIFYGGFEK